MRRGSGNRGAGIMPSEVRVRCSGKLHTISLSPRGQFIRRDHTPAQLRWEEDFMTLGGSPCRCTQVVTESRRPLIFRGGCVPAPPPALRGAVCQMRRLPERDPKKVGQWRERFLARRAWWERPEGVARLVGRV